MNIYVYEARSTVNFDPISTIQDNSPVHLV